MAIACRVLVFFLCSVPQLASSSFAVVRRRRCRSFPTSSTTSTPVLRDDASSEAPTTVTSATASPSDKRRPSSNKIYSQPALYDLAFSYRDYDGEVDFLLDVHRRLAGAGGATDGKNAAKVSVLELGAGPARHSIGAIRRDVVESVACVDLSPEMRDYALEVAKDELASEQRTRLQYLTDDMRTFRLEGNNNKVDTAWILLGSLQHLLENDDVIRCFRSVHRALKSGGTLIVELPHPRETFSMVECTRNEWEVPLEDERGDESGSLRIMWGDDGDEFDPIRQVREFTVKMELEGLSSSPADRDRNSKKETVMQSVHEVVSTRLFTAQEVDALARCSGFRVVEMYGALDEDVDLNDEDAAFRLVCVMQKED